MVNRKDWICRWLQPIDDTMPVLFPDKHFYRQIAFFQFAFYTCWIFYDVSSLNYLWYVSENFQCYETKLTEMRRFATYDEVIDAVALSDKMPWYTELHGER